MNKIIQIKNHKLYEINILKLIIEILLYIFFHIFSIFNSNKFNEFIKDIRNSVKNKLIILDNGQIHKKESTKKIIKDSENYLLYTCPYHPRLNAIEQFFSQMKHYLKLYKSKNYNELSLNLKKSIKNIKKDNYKNYFIYAYKKDYYKNNKSGKKSSKHRKSKIYKT